MAAPYTTRREIIALAASGLFLKPMNELVQRHSDIPMEKLDPYYGLNVVCRYIVPMGLQAVDGLGVHGRFRPETPQIRRNLAYLDANLGPRRFMRAMAHELQHAVHGRSELLAWANTLITFANMFGQYPELLIEDDSKCLFFSILEYYVGRQTKTGIAATWETVPTMLLFGSMQDRGRQLSVKEAYASLIQSPIIESRIESFIQEVASKDFLTLMNARNTFLTEIQKYIVNENPNMPSDKLGLLERKVESIRQGER